MEYYKFSVEGKQFKPSYIIYVIRVCSDKGENFFYVGQTGDRNHITARPPFRRLSGHLDELNKSTQNQLYKGILEKILHVKTSRDEKYTAEIKRKVAIFLEKSGIDMHVFSIMDFPELVESNVHKENVRYIEDVEKNLIELVIKEIGEQALLNKKRHKPSGDKNSQKIASEIMAKIKGELVKKI